MQYGRGRLHRGASPSRPGACGTRQPGGSARRRHGRARSNRGDVRTKLVPTDFFKQDFHRAQESTYSEAIALTLTARQDARALETAELARSRAFADLLATRNMEANGSSVVFRGPPAAASGTAGLRSSVAVTAASAADIAATAARLGSTFLLYWVADEELTVWVVTPGGVVRARRVNVLRSKLDALIRATTPMTNAGNATTLPGSSWRELYDLLIRPVREQLPRTTGSLLTVVPHGPLLKLSFAGLRDARGRYLLEDYAMHYAPAASILQFTSARQHPAGRGGDLLLIADPALPKRSKLDQPLLRLPGARAEAAAIARLVPRGRVTILRDALATESAVRCPPPERPSFISPPTPSSATTTRSDRSGDGSGVLRRGSRWTPDGAGSLRVASRRRHGRVERLSIGRRSGHRRWCGDVRARVHLRRHAVACRESVGRGGRAHQSVIAGVLSGVAGRSMEGRALRSARSSSCAIFARGRSNSAPPRDWSRCRNIRSSGPASRSSASRSKPFFQTAPSCVSLRGYMRIRLLALLVLVTLGPTVVAGSKATGAATPPY